MADDSAADTSPPVVTPDGATAEAPEAAANPAAPPAAALPAGKAGRKRVLALHGNGANSNIMRWQTDMLRSLAGDHFEWEFLDGDEEWTWENAGNSYTDPASAPDGRHNPQPIFMIGVSQGMPFRGWHQVRCDDNSADRHAMQKLFDPKTPFYSNDQLDNSVERVMEHMKANGPYDIVLAFSSGTVVVNIIAGLFRERGEELPWGLTVFFSSVRPRDEKYARLFKEPFTQQAVLVWGRKGKLGDFASQMGADWANQYSKKTVEKMYKNAVVMEHSGGHELPRSGNVEKNVCKKVVKEMFKYCGIATKVE
uniref:Serine hydrolase domain-containing protein n=1 Tax=Alexandrium catenella TaxID=2925 RepID=A0A7S1LP48_ALECA|mmetsp:Transcript_117531/g.312655  ORF Transcript_117531/g.312655 Transcript_117531/m.312655 type:complete len:309 (+) Transcript_117531:59-985(+)